MNILFLSFGRFGGVSKNFRLYYDGLHYVGKWTCTTRAILMCMQEVHLHSKFSLLSTLFDTVVILECTVLVKNVFFFSELKAQWYSGYMQVAGLQISKSDFKTWPCHCIIVFDEKLCFRLSLSTQVYKWAPVEILCGVTLQWTIITSKGDRNTPSLLGHDSESWISSSDLDEWLLCKLICLPFSKDCDIYGFQV